MKYFDCMQTKSELLFSVIIHIILKIKDKLVMSLNSLVKVTLGTCDNIQKMECMLDDFLSKNESDCIHSKNKSVKLLRIFE